jgi:hypothetical protein
LAIMTGTSRRGLRISSDAPLETSNPTHKNTKIPIAVRKPVIDGFRSAAVEAPAGRPCWTRNVMNSTANRPTTAILTKVPMLGPHLPIRNAMIAIPTVTQVNTRPTAISQPVPSGLCRMKLSRAAIVVAVSVPPTQIGFDSQYNTAVTAPAARPKDMRAHSYGFACRRGAYVTGPEGKGRQDDADVQPFGASSKNLVLGGEPGSFVGAEQMRDVGVARLVGRPALPRPAQPEDADGGGNTSRSHPAARAASSTFSVPLTWMS